MSRVRRILLVVPLLSVIAIGAVEASVGGPALAELLGWDARASKVFFRIQYVDEGNQPPRVFCFDLAARKPAQLTRVSWSERDRQDSLYDANLAALRRRLRPLDEHLCETIPAETIVMGVDTSRTRNGPWARYHVRVRDPMCLGDATLEMTTVGDPCVRLIRQWTIPGRSERIALVSFRGLPYETGYEVQVPVLLPRPGEPARNVELPKRDPGVAVHHASSQDAQACRLTFDSALESYPVEPGRKSAIGFESDHVVPATQ